MSSLYSLYTFLKEEVVNLATSIVVFCVFSIFLSEYYFMVFEEMVGSLSARVFVLYLAYKGIKKAIKKETISLSFHRWLILCACLWYFMTLVEYFVRQELDGQANKWFPNVYYLKEHDVYINLWGKNNAHAIGRKTSVVHPKESSILDSVSTFFFSTHNWTPNALNAIVSHEKGHNATFISTIAVQILILCFCRENISWYFSPFVFVLGSTLSSWFFELVADSNVAYLQGIELSKELGTSDMDFGSFGMLSHPPMFLRQYAYQTDRVMWTYCFQYLNHLVGLLSLLWLCFICTSWLPTTKKSDTPSKSSNDNDGSGDEDDDGDDGSDNGNDGDGDENDLAKDPSSSSSSDIALSTSSSSNSTTTSYIPPPPPLTSEVVCPTKFSSSLTLPPGTISQDIKNFSLSTLKKITRVPSVHNILHVKLQNNRKVLQGENSDGEDDENEILLSDSHSSEASSSSAYNASSSSSSTEASSSSTTASSSSNIRLPSENLKEVMGYESSESDE